MHPRHQWDWAPATGGCSATVCTISRREGTDCAYACVRWGSPGQVLCCLEHMTAQQHVAVCCSTTGGVDSVFRGWRAVRHRSAVGSWAGSECVLLKPGRQLTWPQCRCGPHSQGSPWRRTRMCCSVALQRCLFSTSNDRCAAAALCSHCDVDPGGGDRCTQAALMVCWTPWCAR